MDITKILYEIIEEAINGKVMLGDDPWPFYFNTYLEGNEFTNSEECRDWLDKINEISVRN